MVPTKVFAFVVAFGVLHYVSGQADLGGVVDKALDDVKQTLKKTDSALDDLTNGPLKPLKPILGPVNNILHGVTSLIENLLRGLDGNDDGKGKDGNGKDGNGKDGNGKDGNGKDGNGKDGNGKDGKGADPYNPSGRQVYGEKPKREGPKQFENRFDQLEKNSRDARRANGRGAIGPGGDSAVPYIPSGRQVYGGKPKREGPKQFENRFDQLEKNSRDGRGANGAGRYIPIGRGRDSADPYIPSAQQVYGGGPKQLVDTFDYLKKNNTDGADPYIPSGRQVYGGIQKQLVDKFDYLKKINTDGRGANGAGRYIPIGH